MGQIDTLISGEQNRIEETRRMNAERDRMMFLAPEQWRAMKREVAEICARLNSSTPMGIHHESSDEWMTVTRGMMTLFKLQFFPAIPAIRCTGIRNRFERNVVFSMDGPRVFYHENGKAYDVGMIEEFFMDAMR